MKKIKFILLLFFSGSFFGAMSTVLNPEVKIRKDDPIISMLDSLQFQKVFESVNFTDDTAKLNIFNYCSDLVPMFNENEYETRLKILDEKSPFDLVYNPSVQAFIDVYAIRKRSLVSKVLGLSHLYFPIFEQELDRYNLPIEFKYLAIVESALNPKAVSRTGAGGLWQFMYPTGKMFGLNQDSYIDERRDPIKSTEAACKYIKYLYTMFGDYQMVLAAYNCGPGTVNKAIRRSGGKKTYWEIRPYLPLETQNYVPAFIAVNYVMNYSKEHNLYPISPKKEFFFADTLKLKYRTDLNQVASILGISIEDLKFLNPIYKLGTVPFNEEGSVICLPSTKVGAFLANEQLIYDLSKNNSYLAIAKEVANNTKASKMPIYHVTKKGEGIFVLAKKYQCTASEIKSWNKLKGNKILPGKKLIIYVPSEQSELANSKQIEKKENSDSSNIEVSGNLDFSDQNKPTDDSTKITQNASEISIPEFTIQQKTKVLVHVVQRGDTLWNIANRYKGTTVEELKRVNKIWDNKSLKLGAKLKVPISS